MPLKPSLINMHIHLLAKSKGGLEELRSQGSLLATAETLLLPVTFEHVAQELQKLQQLQFEWDGSFVWSGQSEAARWQLDGMLYDVANQLQRIELKGNCPLDCFERLIGLLGCSKDSLIVQMVATGQLMDLSDFENYWWNERNNGTG